MGVINFLPIQEGTGDPSPTNVRPITAPITIPTGKNLVHIVGYSAKSPSNPKGTRSVSNNYGTSLSTTDFTLPDTPVIVTQTLENEYTSGSKANYLFGYFIVVLDNLVFGHEYIVSFKIDNILSNPLNATLSDLRIEAPRGTSRAPATIDGNKIIFNTLPFTQSASYPNRMGLEVYTCGMSFTLSEFMVTDTTEADQSYEPYSPKPIYGGYLDVGNSELVEEYAFKEFTGSEGYSWKTYSTEVIYTANSVLPGFDALSGSTSAIKGFCSHVKTLANENIHNTYLDRPSNNSDGVEFRQVISYWGLSEQSTTELDDYLQDEYEADHPVQVCYYLATPIHHPLNSAQLAFAMDELGVRKSSMLESRRRIMLNSPHLATTTAPIVSFNTDMKADVKSLKVHFAPVQEGTGDPSPTNVRPITGWSGLTAYSGIITHNQLIKNGNFSEGIGSWSGLNASVQNGKIHLYREEGSYSPAYISLAIPYESGDRITSISSHKYLFTATVQTLSGLIAMMPTSTASQGSSGYKSFPQETKLQYIWDCNVNTTISAEIRCYGGSGNTTIPLEFTVKNYHMTDLTDLFGIGKEPTIEEFNAMFPDDYYPYSTANVYNNVVNMTWSNDAGTVYGGYIDLINGELVAEYGQILFDGSISWGSPTKYDDSIYRFVKGPTLVGYPAAKNNGKVYFNYLKSSNGYAAGNGFVGSTGNILLFTDLSIGTGAELMAYQEDNPLQAVYELATPIHYQLTPETIKTLKGTNNIFADTNGDIEVTYWTH